LSLFRSEGGDDESLARRVIPGVRRKWLIRFEPDITRPYVAESAKGTEAFFATPDGLVDFLAGGGLSVDAIRSVIRQIHSAESRNSAVVELEDAWK
jgi:hypothetical protein